jgi:hypothetical protein
MVWRLTIIHYCASYTTAYTRWERGRAHIRWNIGYKVIRNIQCPCCIHTWWKFVTLPPLPGQLSISCSCIPEHCKTHQTSILLPFYDACLLILNLPVAIPMCIKTGYKDYISQHISTTKIYKMCLTDVILVPLLILVDNHALFQKFLICDRFLKLSLSTPWRHIGWKEV